MSLLDKLLLSLHRAAYRWSWSRLELHEVRERFGTPDQIDRYMQICFDYVTDLEHHGIEEHWQDPHTTHELKRGDCEDYALYAWHALRRNDYESHVLAVFTEDEGHAVCVFREHGRYHSICNEGLKRLRLLPRGKSRGKKHRRLARLVADTIYPDRWVCCSYVTRLRELDTDGHASGQTGFLPHYDWIRPPAGDFVPTFTSRRTGGRAPKRSFRA